MAATLGRATFMDGAQVDPRRSLCACGEPVLVVHVLMPHPDSPRLLGLAAEHERQANLAGMAGHYAVAAVHRRDARRLRVVVGELPREMRRIVADPYEWEPRAPCFVCSTIRARGQQRLNCDRCGGEGYVGERRPEGQLVALGASSVRLVGPRTAIGRGEAAHRLHVCALALAA